MRVRMVAAATVAACLTASAPAGANLAVNGGFELPDIATASWSNFGSILGWTPINTCGIEVQDHVAGAPYAGGQFVELNSNCKSGVVQMLPLLTDVAYDVRFAFSPRPGTKADDNVLEVYWNGTLEKTVGPVGGAADTAWKPYAFLAYPAQYKKELGKAYKSTNKLVFRSVGTDPSGGGVGAYLDAVSVTEKSL